MNKKQTSLLLIFAIVVGSFFYFDLGSYLNLAFFQDQRDALVSYQENNFFLSALAYFLLYVFLTAFEILISKSS